MKLIDAIKNTGRPFEIPDCSRDDLPEFFIQMGFKVGAEIGVYKGEFSEKLAKSGLKLYAIDPWKNYKDFYNSRGQARMDFLYEHTQRVLAPYPNATIIRKSSMEAVEDFKDESLDFVYIDGNHSFPFVVNDIYEWSKKVKPGGIIAGDDYVRSKRQKEGTHHVIQAVNGYTKAYQIRPWFILGLTAKIPDLKRDVSRSWFWIKEADKPNLRT